MCVLCGDQRDISHAKGEIAVEGRVPRLALAGKPRHHHLAEAIRRDAAKVVVAAVEDDGRVGGISVVLRGDEVVPNEIVFRVHEAVRHVAVPHDERHADLAVESRYPGHLREGCMRVAHHGEVRRGADAGRDERMHASPYGLRRLGPVSDRMLQLCRADTIPIARARPEAGHADAQDPVVDSGKRHPLRHEPDGLLHPGIVGKLGKSVREGRHGKRNAHRIGRRHLQHRLPLQQPLRPGDFHGVVLVPRLLLAGLHGHAAFRGHRRANHGRTLQEFTPSRRTCQLAHFGRSELRTARHCGARPRLKTSSCQLHRILRFRVALTSSPA